MVNCDAAEDGDGSVCRKSRVAHGDRALARGYRVADGFRTVEVGDRCRVHLARDREKT